MNRQEAKEKAEEAMQRANVKVTSSLTFSLTSACLALPGLALPGPLSKITQHDE